MNNIRNFVIIAHIDAGKSTLADRFLEVTGTVEPRRMRAQYLDQLELERERGITIKMAPVRMEYKVGTDPYVLNLIDTPGHSDFSYEVSRALEAVEGGILLVDATKGIQAQTLSNFRAAKKAGLVVVGAVNKIDAPSANTEECVLSLADLLGQPPESIFRVSAKTGDGVRELLDAVVKVVPSPSVEAGPARALIFDSFYDDHKGILAYVRVVGGEFRREGEAYLYRGETKCRLKEVGYFSPEFRPAETLAGGGIGYLATGLKEAARVRIGDTVLGEDPKNAGKDIALPGYKEAAPVVFISFYPDGGTKYDDLKKSLDRLRLSDAALIVEPDANDALGRGFKVGFLGQLHFEITASRLEREFGLEFLTSFPSISYRVLSEGKELHIEEPHAFPASPEKVWEPIIEVEVLTPAQFLASVRSLERVFALEVTGTETIGSSVLLRGIMPLAELVRDFDDQLKSVSQGFASFNYVRAGDREADVVKLEILVGGKVVPALTRIVSKRELEREGRRTVERLKELLPRAQFVQAIQASADGRIIARENLPALKKDVTGHLYGGDRTRKMKLWKKQKRGKERLKEHADVTVPVDVFREILKK